MYDRDPKRRNTQQDERTAEPGASAPPSAEAEASALSTFIGIVAGTANSAGEGTPSVSVDGNGVEAKEESSASDDDEDEELGLTVLEVAAIVRSAHRGGA